MVTVNTLNGPMDFQDKGKGPALILLNGLSRTTQHWLGFDDKLCFEGFRVITVDLRGVGQNPRHCPWNLSIRKMATDVLDVIEYLSIDKVHIWGISLGGMVALEAGILAPHRCQSLTMVNSSLAFWNHLFSRLSFRAMAFLMKYAILRPDMDTAAKELVDMVVGIDMPAQDRHVLATNLAEIESRYPTDFLVVFKQLLAAARYRPLNNLRNFDIPTQLLVGEYDFFVPRQNSFSLSKAIPHSKVHIIKSGGHELMYDKPDKVIQHTLEFINNIEKQWFGFSKSI